MQEMSISINKVILNYSYKEYLSEELLIPFLKYTDIKIIYPIKIIVLTFQTDHNNPRKIQLHEESRSATSDSRLFMILIRHRVIKMISDENQINEVTFFLK